jgi:hypothetical protein
MGLCSCDRMQLHAAAGMQCAAHIQGSAPMQRCCSSFWVSMLLGWMALPVVLAGRQAALGAAPPAEQAVSRACWAAQACRSLWQTVCAAWSATCCCGASISLHAQPAPCLLLAVSLTYHVITAQHCHCSTQQQLYICAHHALCCALRASVGDCRVRRSSARTTLPLQYTMSEPLRSPCTLLTLCVCFCAVAVCCRVKRSSACLRSRSWASPPS